MSAASANAVRCACPRLGRSSYEGTHEINAHFVAAAATDDSALGHSHPVAVDPDAVSGASGARRRRAIDGPGRHALLLREPLHLAEQGMSRAQHLVVGVVRTIVHQRAQLAPKAPNTAEYDARPRESSPRDRSPVGHARRGTSRYRPTPADIQRRVCPAQTACGSTRQHGRTRLTASPNQRPCR